MSPRGRPLRLFVAVYPPPETVAHLQRLCRPAAGPNGREVPAEQVHLTLHFVGPTAPERLDAVCESVQAACAGVRAFTLRPKRLISLPAGAAPRLVAAETDAPPGVLDLRRRLVQRLATSPRRDPADRFLPHLTLYRFLPGSHGPAMEQEVECPAFEVRTVLLMRSVLHATGARHSEILAVALEA